MEKRRPTYLSLATQVVLVDNLTPREIVEEIITGEKSAKSVSDGVKK
jgi:shikimate kinase